MGLFSNIKNKIQEMINRSKRQGLPEAQEYQIENNNEYLNNSEMIILPNGDNFSINSIKFDRQVKHSDGRISNIMIASTVRVGYGEAMLLGENGTDKVVFEIPEGESITPTILNKIANYSDFLNHTDQKYIYIGEINSDVNDNSLRKSSFVEKHMYKDLIPVFENERNVNMKRMEQSNRYSQENYFDSIRVNINERNKREDELKKSRMQNPFLNRIDNSMDQTGKMYNNFNGVNINTGDILRIRNLDKLGKDENGNNLYQAFIANTSREDFRVFNNDYIGGNYVPICFTSKKEIEDIVAQQDNYDINSVLELFSQPQIFNEECCPDDQLNYIGSLDSNMNFHWELLNEGSKEFYINYDGGRRNSALSETMRNAISNIQKNFYNKMQEKNKGNERL